MAARTRTMKPWTAEEIELCEIFVSLPSLSEIAATMGRDYNALKAKIHQIRTGELVPGDAKRTPHQYISADKIKGLEITAKRQKMIDALEIGQEMLVKEVRNKTTYRGNLIQKTPYFLRVQMTHNARIATINTGEIISRDVLIGTMRGVRAYE